MAERLDDAFADTALTSNTSARILPPGEEAARLLSDLYNEPDWMRQARQEAWSHYAAMDLPSPKEEAWRRTDLRAYPLDALRVVFSARELDGIYDLPPCWDYALAPVDQVSGVL